MNRPDVTMMLLVHGAFRRDLVRMREASTAPGRLPEVQATWRTFCRYLTIHHTAEDEILWPALQAELAEPTELLIEMAAEHAALDPLLNRIQDLLDRGTLDPLPAVLHELSTVLTAHLAHEESAALPLVQRVLTERQWQAFADGQRQRVGLRGGARFFPWLLDGAAPEQAAWALNLLPPPVRLLCRRIWQPRYERGRRELTAAHS